MVIRCSILQAAMVAGLFLGSAAAHASVLFNFVETGGDVVGTASGSLDLTGAAGFPTPSYGPGIGPVLAEIIATPGSQNGDFYYTTGPSSFGSGFGATGTATGSGAFEVEDGDIVVPANYVNGTPIDNTLTVVGTYASLGITPGTYQWTVNGASDQTVTVVFNLPSSVPEPATLWLLVPAVGVIGLAHRRQAGAAA